MLISWLHTFITSSLKSSQDSLQCQLQPKYVTVYKRLDNPQTDFLASMQQNEVLSGNYVKPVLRIFYFGTRQTLAFTNFTPIHYIQHCLWTEKIILPSLWVSCHLEYVIKGKVFQDLEKEMESKGTKIFSSLTGYSRTNFISFCFCQGYWLAEQVKNRRTVCLD